MLSIDPSIHRSIHPHLCHYSVCFWAHICSHQIYDCIVVYIKIVYTNSNDQLLTHIFSYQHNLETSTTLTHKPACIMASRPETTTSRRRWETATRCSGRNPLAMSLQRPIDSFASRSAAEWTNAAAATEWTRRKKGWKCKQRPQPWHAVTLERSHGWCHAGWGDHSLNPNTNHQRHRALHGVCPYSTGQSR